MKPRQFDQIAGPWKDRYALLSEGLTAIAENGQALENAAEELSVGGHFRGAQILRTIAQEEAGKFLILLDAVRLGRQNQKGFRVQLKRAGDHLAKGLYAKAAEIRPANFEELIAYIDHERESHFLDGPNDVDWIFRNQVLANREEVLYVDLVETDGNLVWLTPARFDILGGGGTPNAVSLMSSLMALGCNSPRALPLVASIWQGFTPKPNTPWTEVRPRIERTIQELRDHGLVTVTLTENDVRLVLAAWPFPLHSVDLEKMEIDVSALDERRGRFLARLNAGLTDSEASADGPEPSAWAP